MRSIFVILKNLQVFGMPEMLTFPSMPKKFSFSSIKKIYKCLFTSISVTLCFKKEDAK